MSTNWMMNIETSYDANGNIVLLPMMRMDYDTQDRLARVDTLDGTERYGYDHKNLRVWTQAADGSESFSLLSWDEKPCHLRPGTDAQGNPSFRLSQSNIYFGKRLAQSGGEVVVTDRLGSTRAWSAKKGAKTASYMPFGEKVNGQDDEQQVRRVRRMRNRPQVRRAALLLQHAGALHVSRPLREERKTRQSRKLEPLCLRRQRPHQPNRPPRPQQHRKQRRDHRRRK